MMRTTGLQKTLTFCFLFLATGAFAQVIDRQKIKIEPIQPITPVISESLTLPAASRDSVYPEDSPEPVLIQNAIQPDEHVSDIFSEKMDSLANSWYIRNLFHDDFSQYRGVDEFPRNLPDSVYISRLQGIQQVIAMSYNSMVKDVIKFYTEKRRDQVEMMLGLSAYYFPIFEEALDRYNMPLELKYLPVIESALNPKAISRAGANGLWQFMFNTGRQLGLEISSFVDERRDPVKSTEAAVKYLWQLYQTYNDWYLAIAAYNCGPGNLDRAIKRSGGKRSFWEIYYYLPRETRGYVPAFVAASYVMNYYKEHNLIPRMPDISLQTDTLMIRDYLHLNQLEKTLGIEKEQLRSLNPMYRRDVIPAKPDKPYPVVLPNEKINPFIDLDTTVFAYEREKYFPDNKLGNPVGLQANYFTPADVEGKAKILYTVKSGDNVGFISSWFNVRLSDLRYWNNLHRDLIRVGQKLSIYVAPENKEKYEKLNSMTFTQKQASIGKSVRNNAVASSANPNTTKPAMLDSSFEYYTVRKGDTIWEIAKRYPGISPDEILRLNNLSARSKISIGQKLKIKSKENI
ncbi:MAG: transglycosylase SLT domain-containing protein [Mariniphaga sp.]